MKYHDDGRVVEHGRTMTPAELEGLRGGEVFTLLDEHGQPRHRALMDASGKVHHGVIGKVGEPAVASFFGLPPYNGPGREGTPGTDWCKGCGMCCMHTRTPPFLMSDDPEWLALPQELRDEIDDWTSGSNPRFNLMADHDDGELNPCLWLDLVTGRCRHYEHRPEICRDYEVGNSSCRTARGLVGLTVAGMPVVDEE